MKAKVENVSTTRSLKLVLDLETTEDVQTAWAMFKRRKSIPDLLCENDMVTEEQAEKIQGMLTEIRTQLKPFART